MQFLTTILAIVTMAGLTVAAPAPEASPEAAPQPPVDLEKRQSLGVFVTQDINWGGRSEHLIVVRGQCLTLGNGWPNVISAFGPDSGLTCTIWDNNGCTGPSFGPITFPGIANLVTVGWNDRINSFRCN
ncbi:hypothetical protein QC764_510715 [Podospora pseudoanserina]|uniref:Uncharacterized protein n=1 Tax=Podospora pseudoanserina TaxID=2609844 RepID=A0ABR0I863_9PEZI|nr:hypothetical protein QC764_510715 [Podospora pseudoanserina]